MMQAGLGFLDLLLQALYAAVLAFRTTVSAVDVLVLLVLMLVLLAVRR